MRTLYVLRPALPILLVYTFVYTHMHSISVRCVGVRRHSDRIHTRIYITRKIHQHNINNAGRVNKRAIKNIKFSGNKNKLFFLSYERAGPTGRRSVLGSTLCSPYSYPDAPALNIYLCSLFSLLLSPSFPPRFSFPAASHLPPSSRDNQQYDRRDCGRVSLESPRRPITSLLRANDSAKQKGRRSRGRGRGEGLGKGRGEEGKEE